VIHLDPSLHNCCLNWIETDSSAKEGESKARTQEGSRTESTKGYRQEVGTDYIEDCEARYEETT
jgi:hypothetical protein